MNWYLDVFADDVNDTNASTLATIRNLLDADRSGPCEDDCEVTAPYIGICPDETSFEKETPSPLDFGGERRYGETTKPASQLRNLR